MGEKIGSMGDVRKPQEKDMADEIAKQLENAEPFVMDEDSKAKEAKDAKEGRQATKLNRFGEIVSEEEAEK